MKTKRVLMKLGGAALDGGQALQSVASALHHYRAGGSEVILVHGGGPAINAELTKRGLRWEFVGGQRVTTPAMMDAIMTTLTETVNHRLVSYFQSQDLPVVSCSGASRQTLLCTQASPALGLVGQIQQVHVDWMDLQSTIPVLAPVGIGSDGDFFNINADWAASYLAVALQVDELTLLTNQPGIIDEEGCLIRKVSVSGLKNMIDRRVVSGGMLTKTLAILHALENGIPSVRVMHAESALQSTEVHEVGTVCGLQEVVYANDTLFNG